jgi:hypothetical protein
MHFFFGDKIRSVDALLTVCQEVKNFKFCVKILRFCDSSQDRSTAEPFNEIFGLDIKTGFLSLQKEMSALLKSFIET